MTTHERIALLLVALALGGCAGPSENPCDRLAGIITACGDTYQEWLLEACREDVAENCSRHDVRVIHGFYDCLDDAGLTECNEDAVDTGGWAAFGDCYSAETERLSAPCRETGVSIAEF